MKYKMAASVNLVPKEDIGLQNQEDTELNPELCVSSFKRKIGDPLSPESIRLEPEVSVQPNISTPVRKKRHIIGGKKKGQRLRNSTRAYIAKHSAVVKKVKTVDSQSIDSRDGDNDDDYDTSDELPLSGLVRGELDRDNDNKADIDPENDPNPADCGTKVKPKGPRRAKRRVQTKADPNIQSIMYALAMIQTDIAAMKLDGNKRDLTLKTVDTSMMKLVDDGNKRDLTLKTVDTSMTKLVDDGNKRDLTLNMVDTSITQLVNDSMTKEGLDNVLTGLVNQIGSTLDEHTDSLKKQDACLTTHQKQLDDNAATLEVHDVRLTSLEKDITDDLQHFKKRLEGLEYRLDKVIPPPALLPVSESSVNQPNDLKAVTYADALKYGKREVPPQPASHQSQQENKSLIIEGLNEYPLENLEEVVFELLAEIGIRMTDSDYNKMERLGRWNPTRNWPRPIKLELVTTHKRNKILACKDQLQDTSDYYNVRIQQDEAKRVRVGKAMLRQLANRARLDRKSVQQTTTSVTVDGKRYDLDNIHKYNESHPARNRKTVERVEKPSRNSEAHPQPVSTPWNPGTASL